MMMVILIFILGAVLGSFLNVCIYRLPRNLSLVLPGSFCPHCRKPIAWFDNIPILSYLLLAGRCRNCHGKITARYFWVELLTAGLLTGLYLRFGLSASFFIFSLFVVGLLVASFIDLEHFLIPDLVVYPGIFLGLLFHFLFPELAASAGRLTALGQSLIGLLVGVGLFSLLSLGGRLVFKKEALGGGDIKLLGMIGAFLGWKSVLMTIFFGSLVGSVVGLLLILLKIKKRTDYIPFGPYLSLGAVVSLFLKGSYFLGYPI